jgi:hypothetical protein
MFEFYSPSRNFPEFFGFNSIFYAFYFPFLGKEKPFLLCLFPFLLFLFLFFIFFSSRVTGHFPHRPTTLSLFPPCRPTFPSPFGPSLAQLLFSPPAALSPCQLSFSLRAGPTRHLLPLTKSEPDPSHPSSLGPQPARQGRLGLGCGHAPFSQQPLLHTPASPCFPHPHVP